MNLKRKSLRSSLFIVLVLNAFAAANAVAETGGHFTSNAANTTIHGVGEETDKIKTATDGGTPIECTSATYTTTLSGTQTSIALTPHYSSCRTEGEKVGDHKVSITMNSCEYQLTVSNNPSGDNTVHLVCPSGITGITVEHPNCTYRLPAQTPSGGVAYIAGFLGGAKAITADFTLTGMTAHYEAGICTFLGTKHTATLDGSVILTGSANNNPVSIEATG